MRALGFGGGVGDMRQRRRSEAETAAIIGKASAGPVSSQPPPLIWAYGLSVVVGLLLFPLFFTVLFIKY